MQTFSIVPEIDQMDTVKEFCDTFRIGDGDLLMVFSKKTYEQYFKGSSDGAVIVNFEDFATGEPTDLLVESIYETIKTVSYQRVIAVGGGTILDVAKLFSLKYLYPVGDLYDRKLPVEKDKTLILVPTTCGTGSEMTNISILELTKKHTKFGLADTALYADHAVLIPELLNGLPYRVFAAAAIDALVHAVESFTSPKANAYTRMFSESAMRTIIKNFMAIAEEGPDSVGKHLKEMLMASNFAGIAFGNAGCAAVHAMSYPLGAARHVPHGESNYVMFLAVYRTYMQLAPEGSITVLNQLLADIFGCDVTEVYEQLATLLEKILPWKSMSAYGVQESDIADYTETVMTKQGRLMANNYTELDAETVRKIYLSVL